MSGPPPPSQKDANQVLRYAFDDADGALRVDANITLDTADLEISYMDDSMAIGDPSSNNILKINNNGSINSEVIGPTGNTLLPNSDGSINVDATIEGIVPITGTLNPVGLKTGLQTSQLTITGTAQRVPTIDLANRNVLSVRILGTNVVYFGNSSVTTSIGYPKYQFEEMALDIQANGSVDLWAVCLTGQTCTIAILEIA